MSSARYGLNQCSNMNHGRSNVAIKFCPECGMRFDTRSNASCGTEKHAELRRQRHKFCVNCGLDLKVAK